jgi:hypothetical protein
MNGFILQQQKEKRTEQKIREIMLKNGLTFHQAEEMIKTGQRSILNF